MRIISTVFARSVLLFAAVLLFVGSVFPVSAYAGNVDSVTLFPGAALITESAKVTPDAEGVAVLRLPALADPASLRLAAGGGASVLDVSWKRESPEDSSRVAEARARLETAETRRDAARADLDAAKAQQEFWKRQGAAGELKAQDAARLAGLLGEKLPALGRTIASNGRDLIEREKDVADARRELDRLAGGAEASWRVEATVARAAPVTLTYTYRARGCGWQPVYTLDARPRADMVRYSFQAEMWQATGGDWANVPLTLATLEPRSGLVPPPVRPWILEPRRVVERPMARGKTFMSNMAVMDSDQAQDLTLEQGMVGAVPPPPHEVGMGTFAAWQLGRRSLAAGKRPRVTLESEDWKAEFLYTLRPSVTPDAFLTASVQLASPRELPPGQALFLVDGAVLGRRMFSAAGKEVELFFGSDPLVVGKMDLDEKQSGEKGFFGKKQTLLWSWLITAENHKPHAVTVRVEDPRPRVRDERINLTLTTKPTAKTDGDVLYWQARLAPGEKMAVTHMVQATAPEDMDVDPGR